MVKRTNDNLLKWLPLFYVIGRERSRIGGNKHEVEDLVQEAWLRLQNADIDTSNRAVVAIQIKCRMIDYIRTQEGRLGSHKRKHHIYNCTLDDDVLGGADKRFEEIDSSDEFEYLINAALLGKEEKLILRLCFVKGLLQDEIARVIGVSPSRISQRLTNILKILKAQLVA